MTRRNLTYLPLLLISVLILAGCGGGDDGGDSSGGAPGPDNTTQQGASDPNTTQVSNPSTNGSTTPTDGSTPTDPNSTGMDGTADPNASGTGSAEAPVVEGGEDLEGLGSLDGATGLFVTDESDKENSEQAAVDSLNAEASKDVSGGTTDSTVSETDTSSKVSYTYGPAKISIDGKTFTLDKGAQFPESDPMFELTEIKSDYVEISLIAGEFADGSDAVELSVGETWKMLNQDEGVNYKIKLKKVVKSSSGEGSGSSYGDPYSGGASSGDSSAMFG